MIQILNKINSNYNVYQQTDFQKCKYVLHSLQHTLN